MALCIAITGKDGQTRRLSFDSHDITVGRSEDNDLCLPLGSVSKRHTRIAVEDGKVFVLDLQSKNGTDTNDTTYPTISATSSTPSRRP